LLSVLLIDDEPALLEVLRLFSERSHEMSVHTAQSAKEALGILPDKRFDAIIVDYDMPEIDGIEFLKILRSEGDTTPIIIFTGVGHEHTAIEAINNGANFFLKKGEDPQMQFRELVTMVKTAVERTYRGKNLGTSKRIISDMINFSSDPGFAIDREGKVAAWNASLEQLTDTPAKDMIDKNDYVYAEPFFGTRRKMLANLVFEPDDEIKRNKYMIVSRIANGPIIAVTKGSSPQTSKPAQGFFDKILGKTTAYYKEGVTLFIHEKKYPEAIIAFNKALELDDKLPHVWNDLGLCYRQMGDNKSALKSLLRAVELAPENPEFLFNLGETLEMIGVLYMSNKYLESAIQTFKMVANAVPNNASTWNHIGICYKELGKPEESKFYFDRARDIHIWKKDTPINPKRNEVL